ncbi:MAG: rSAM/selenodomain-associated transferase 1 [Thermoproteota archaeon]|jgi:rSAM/selenodomain-associated transferase 1
MKKLNKALILFAKTPGLTPVKTRLSKDIGRTLADEFYQLSIEMLKKRSTSFCNKYGIDLLIAINEKEASDKSIWKGFNTLYQGEGQLGDKLFNIMDLVGREYSQQVVIGSDLPHISEEILINSFMSLDEYEHVLGPASDGGFYLYGTSLEVTKEFWQGFTWSSDIVCSQLRDKIKAPLYLLPELTDIDQVSDLNLMNQEILNLSLEQSEKQIIQDFCSKI